MRPLLLAAVVFVVALPAGAQEISAPRLTVLDNGLRVITVEDRKSPVVTVVWSAHVGDSAEPPEFGGNSHYLEHLLLFRGTKKYPKDTISERVSGAGGYFNGHTWYDWTTFEIMLPSDRLDDILDMHEQMMFEAAFAGADFETEKKAVFEELRGSQDRPNGYLYRRAPYKMYDGETFYSRDTIGTIETVQAATVEKVRRYYRDYYVPNNITLVLVGDFSTEAALEKVRARFSKRKAGKVAAPPYRALPLRPGVTVVSEERNAGKSYFLAAFEGPPASSPDFAPFQVLMTWLTEGKTAPLTEELLERRKLLDRIWGEANPRRFPGGWQAFGGDGDPARMTEGVAALFGALAKVRAEGIPPETLTLVKNRMISQDKVENESLYNRAMGLARADAHGDYRLASEAGERWARVTAEDVWTVAAKYLDPGHCFVMALFPVGTTPKTFTQDVQAAATSASGTAGGSLAEVRLSSGATLLFDARPGAAVESFSAAVMAGDRHDGARPGTAEAVLGMVKRLTARRGRTALQEYLDQQGITLTGEARKDGTILTLTAPAGKTAVVGALLRELLSEPAFVEEEWAVVKRMLVANVTAGLDQPPAVAFNALQVLVYPGTPYGTPFAARQKSFEGMSTADLTAFHRRYYRPERIAVAYSGAASRASVEAALQGPIGASGAISPLAEPVFAAAPPPAVARAAVPMAGKKQVNLYWAWPGVDLGSDDWVLWMLASRAFGGDLAARLWPLRQKEGLAYSVSTFDFPNRDRPLTGIFMAMEKEKYPQASAALDREIARLLEGLTAAELERVKTSYLANLERQDAATEQRSRRHAAWRLAGFGPDYRARLRRVVGAASLEDVNRVVRTTLTKDRMFKAEAGAVE